MMLILYVYIGPDYGIQLDYSSEVFQSMHMTLSAPLAKCDPTQDVKAITSSSDLPDLQGNVAIVCYVCMDTPGSILFNSTISIDHFSYISHCNVNVIRVYGDK